jgi:imidazole glycerol-phosphate synthase subunit HisF
LVKKRLIPCLFLKNGLLVRSENFKYHQLLGDPLHQVERINDWGADELIYIDITENEDYEFKRDDMKNKSVNSIFDILEFVSKKCFIPLTFGGNIKDISKIREFLKKGADKVLINSIAFEKPEFISEASKLFGRQCIVVGIDVKINNNKYEVFINKGKTPTGKDPINWAREVEKLGAGEIFINSIDRDGSGEGYDLDLIKSITDVVSIPVICCGGVGIFEHFIEGFTKGNASAVAAGNIFNFTENSVIKAKKVLKNEGLEMRDIIKYEE